MDAGVKNLLFETLTPLRLLVTYHTAAAPSDVEWQAWHDATEVLWKNTPDFLLLVVSDGGHPARKQVARLKEGKRRLERLGGKARSEPLTAIVSCSVAMRFVVSTVSLFNPKIRCYASTEQQLAYRHLGLTPSDAMLASAAVERLRNEGSGTVSAARASQLSIKTESVPTAGLSERAHARQTPSKLPRHG
jgi:hypothetical protein